MSTLKSYLPLIPTNVRPPLTALLLIGSLCTIISIYWIRTPAANNLALPPASYNYETITDPVIQTSKSAFSLIDITLPAGIMKMHTQHSEHLSGLHESLGAGTCAMDYNNDGWMDLLVLNGSGTTYFYGKPQWWQTQQGSITLYRNNKDGTFFDATKESQLESSGWSMGCASADLDNDGDEDIVISNYGANELWRNNNNGTFTNITQTAGFLGQYWSTGINLVDINHDGLLDIYINNFIQFKTNSLTLEKKSGYHNSLQANFTASLYNGTPNQLFINQGKLHFTEHAKALGVDNPQGRSLSSLWVDLNNDQQLDVIIANAEGSANKVLISDLRTSGKFIDISTHSQLGFINRAAELSNADFNDDGKPELLVTLGPTAYTKIYTPIIKAQPTSLPTFLEVSDHYQLKEIIPINRSQWGSVIHDFNLDGWLDVFIANGMTTYDSNSPLLSIGQPNTLLINKKGAQFINQSSHIAPNTYAPYSSRCAATADFDNNGSPDIFVANNNGLGQLLKNTIRSHQWLGIILQSDNQPETGAKVTVIFEQNSQKKTRTLMYGSRQSFLCASDKRLIFGLGNLPHNQTVDIRITWPNGDQQHINDLNINRYHLVKDGLKPTHTFDNSLITNQSLIRLTQPTEKLTVTNWLIQYGRLAIAEKELKVLIHHPNTEIRQRTFSLSQRLSVAQRVGFIQLAINDPEVSIRLKAIEAIRHNEDERFNRWLLKQLAHKNHTVVCASAQAYTHFYEEEEAYIIQKYTALTSLIHLLDSKDTKKRYCAIEALGQSEHYRALAPLTNLLADKDDSIREVAIRALGHLKEKAALPLLRQRLYDAQEITSVRAAALIAIQQLDSRFRIKKSLMELLKQEKIHFKSETRTRALIDQAYLSSQDRVVVQKALRPYITLTEQPTKVNDAVMVTPTMNCNDLLSDHEELHSSQLAQVLTCLKSENIYHSELAIVPYLSTRDGATRKKLLKLMAARSERWARRLMLDVLSSTQYTIGEQQLVLQHLPKPLPVSLSRPLNDLLTNDPLSPLAPMILKNLIDSKEDTAYAKALSQFKDSFNNQPSQTLAFADALIMHSPDVILNMLVTTGAHNE